MKIPRWIKLALVVAFLGLAICDVFSSIADARDYYKTSEFHWLAVLLGATLLGAVILIYRDIISDKAKTLHAFVAVTALAAVITVCATYMTGIVIDYFCGAIPKHKLLFILALIFFYGVAVGLWWQAIVLWKKHRTTLQPLVAQGQNNSHSGLFQLAIASSSNQLRLGNRLGRIRTGNVCLVWAPDVFSHVVATI